MKTGWCAAEARRAVLAQDEFDDFLCHEVRPAKVEAGDGDEPEHHGRGLRDLAAVWPLYALQLGPACAQEADDTIAAAQRCARGALPAPTPVATGASPARG